MALSRSALARIAAACSLAPVASLAHPPPPVAADEPALVMSCTTPTLSYEEVEAGALSEITCEWVEPGEWVGTMFRATTVAVHYDGVSGINPSLVVTGNCYESIALSTNDPWNNAISSTRHQACGTIKHYDLSNMSGDTYVTTGGSGMLWGDLDAMNNRTSSVGYA
jgi:hypothetical protein